MGLPTHPNFTDEEDEQVSDPSAEALDLRIMVRELVVVGPQTHRAEVTVEEPRDSQTHWGEVTVKEPRDSHRPPLLPPAWRMTRVCYRRRPCAVQVPAQTCTLVVPQCSFAAVCSALDEWA